VDSGYFKKYSIGKGKKPNDYFCAINCAKIIICPVVVEILGNFLKNNIYFLM
jgi:hypothetical protein